MAAEIKKIDPAHPDRAFSRAREIVSRGGVIVYPTDTFYGLGADPKNAQAVKRLFRIKDRETDQPILLLIHDAAAVTDWASEVNEQAERLMKMYWPGPLTIVFKAKKQVPAGITGGKGTIGLRVPGNALTRKLLEYVKGPLTGTSANISGGGSVQTIGELDNRLLDRVDLILDSGPAPGGRPSTVVDVSTGQLIVIREGAVKL